MDGVDDEDASKAGSFRDFDRSRVCFDCRNLGSFDEGDDAEGPWRGFEEDIGARVGVVVVAWVVGVVEGGERRPELVVVDDDESVRARNGQRSVAD